MESQQVAQRTADNLGDGTTADEVQEATSATAAKDLDAITVKATMPTGVGAAAMVDALVGAYEEIVTEQVHASANESIATLEFSKAETQARIAELDDLIAQNPDDSVLKAERTAATAQLIALDTRIKELSTNAALYGSGVQAYDPPDVPTAPFQPLPKRNAVVAFVVGAVAAGVAAQWRSEQNQIVDNRDTPARILDAPLLAVVPDFRLTKVSGPAPTITNPMSEVSEAYLFALSSVGLALEKVDGRSVLLTSTVPGEGKTSTALNLAIVATRHGRETLLVDTDERHSDLTILADLESEPGISDINTPDSVDRCTHRWTLVDGTAIDVVPAGTSISGTSPSFLHPERIRVAMELLLKNRDLVVVDSPPVLAVPGTADVAAAVDGIVFVVAAGTPLKDLADARQRLAMSGTPIIGYIFNRATSRLDGYGYGYGD